MGKKMIAGILVSAMVLLALAGCEGRTTDNGSAETAATATPTAASEPTATATVAPTEPAATPAPTAERENSPEWVVKLGEENNATQLFVVAVVGQTTAYVSMHEKDAAGNWKLIVTTPGYIGRLGMGKTKEGDARTPKGVFHFTKAFGIADDPGCKGFEYLKVTDDLYWSGDSREGYHYNEMVSIRDYPDLDKENSEHIVDYNVHYQYCMNISYNEAGVPGEGSAIFLHCLGPNKPFTGGCVAIPENQMAEVLRNVTKDCVIVIDSLKTLSPETWEAWGLADEDPGQTGMTDEEIIAYVMESFEKLAAVPRPSHHEEKIGAFFMEWAKAQGLSPVQDKVGNVMFDVPATEGLENLPLCVIQGHMDMVVAVAGGKTFDPQNDPITIIWDKVANTLTADGTSLGADDGTGCILAMAAAQGKIAHGPLRILITVDEEDGMEGAFGMDASWLQGAKYLINIDNEASGQVLVSSAAGEAVHASGKVDFSDAKGDLAVTVELSGLKGGHSGIEIDKERVNAIIKMAVLLKNLELRDIDWDLASFEGGTASNAIPSSAAFTIVVNSKDREKLVQLLDSFHEILKTMDEGATIRLNEEETIPKTVSREQRDNAIRFMTELIDGVYTMSVDMEGLVESSSNLGIFKLNQDGVTAVANLRSSSAEKEVEIRESHLALAKACGYETELSKMADAWPVDPNSRLAERTKKVYKDLTGKDIQVVAIHAGLECGTFKILNPGVDMISIGPDIHDPHSINETLFLDSMPETWRLLAGILAGLD